MQRFKLQKINDFVTYFFVQNSKFAAFIFNFIWSLQWSKITWTIEEMFCECPRKAFEGKTSTSLLKSYKKMLYKQKYRVSLFLPIIARISPTIATTNKFLFHSFSSLLHFVILDCLSMITENVWELIEGFLMGNLRIFKCFLVQKLSRDKNFCWMRHYYSSFLWFHKKCETRDKLSAVALSGYLSFNTYWKRMKEKTRSQEQEYKKLVSEKEKSSWIEISWCGFNQARKTNSLGISRRFNQMHSN